MSRIYRTLAKYIIGTVALGIMTLSSAILLSACDHTFDNASDKHAPRQNLSKTADEHSSVKRLGAHNQRDPHSKLSAKKHLQVTLQHLKEGRQQLAMSTLTSAISQYPKSAQLYGVRGSILLEQGSSGAALADLNRAIELAPNNPEFLTNRAQVYRRFERNDDAMADLDRAIELDSRFVAAFFNRGALAFSSGKYQQALTDFDTCIRVAPQSAAPYFNRASVHDAMGRRELAIADLTHFITIADSEKWREAANALLLKWNGVKKSSASVQSL